MSMAKTRIARAIALKVVPPKSGIETGPQIELARWTRRDRVAVMQDSAKEPILDEKIAEDTRRSQEETKKSQKLTIRPRDKNPIKE